MDYNKHILPFNEEVDWMEMTRQLSSFLPEEAFFIKDLKGRFMMQNRRAVETCHASHEEETLGKRDADFWSEDRVRMYVAGDRQVIETGEPIINELAPAPEEAGSNNMVIYSKFPVKDRTGKIIGVAGIHRLIDEKSSASTSLGILYKAVQRMHQDFSENLSIKDLARVACLSQSQFERRFRKVIGSSPREYLIRVRVRAACQLLEQTNWTIARTALECGFYDHSHFSHAFRKQMANFKDNAEFKIEKRHPVVYFTKPVLHISDIAWLGGEPPSSTLGKKKKDKRPNIILIMADDLGWGDVGFNGNNIIKTPNLDELASEGIIFNRFYSASSVCSPTRASVLTGRNPYRTGIPTANKGFLRPEEVTLPETVTSFFPVIRVAI